MYGTTEQVIREHYEDLGREAARVRPAPMEREDHEAKPYVVRDLSWELARFLETSRDRDATVDHEVNHGRPFESILDLRGP